MLPQWQTNLAHQLEELHLIRCSLLPGERLAFVLSPEDQAVWTSLLDAFTDVNNSDRGLDVIASLAHPPCQARFELRVVGSQTWFEVELPRCTDPAPAHASAHLAATTISVKGEHLSRDAHEHWHTDIRTRTAEIDDACAFPVYELLTLLTAALYSEASSLDPSSTSFPATTSQAASTSPPQQVYHALLTSHHLVSPTKRRSMCQWSSQLGLTGFAKVGYPGVIYAEGLQDAVETFVRNVKGMQWLALRIRFVEPVSDSNTILLPTRSERWVEVSKIAEVLEQMRMRGREALVTNLGIGGPSKETKR